MDKEELIRSIEAVIFASGEPIAANKLAQIFETDEETVTALVGELAAQYDESGSALRIVRTAEQYQICTRPQYAPYIRAALELRRNTPLSNAAMETLAIIAYNEPVTRNIIERVRGVDSSGVVSSLLAKGLIEEKGRLDLPGRPMQYQTTTLFLRSFGIESLTELPPLPQSGGEELPGLQEAETAKEEENAALEDSAED